MEELLCFIFLGIIFALIVNMEQAMIQCITTDQDISQLGDLAFKCPVCSQVYEIAPYSNSDYLNEYKKFECYECGTRLEVDVTTHVRYTVTITTPLYEILVGFQYARLNFINKYPNLRDDFEKALGKMYISWLRSLSEDVLLETIIFT